MKAKVINPESDYFGRIVNVRKMEDTQLFANRYEMIYGNGVFFGDELDFEFNEKQKEVNIDWSAFRIEAAKDAMSGMMANADFWQHIWSYNRVNGRCDYPSEVAHFAVACADELIKQLKEEQK